MIAQMTADCDYKQCTIRWFHFVCVGLKILKLVLPFVLFTNKQELYQHMVIHTQHTCTILPTKLRCYHYY